MRSTMYQYWLHRSEKKTERYALKGSWHLRPHHHRVPIDANLPILQQYRCKLSQHRYLVCRWHTVSAEGHLHRAHVKHAVAACTGAKIGTWLKPAMRRS